MIGEYDEEAAKQEVVELRCGPLCYICFTFDCGPIMFCSMRSNCYDLFFPLSASCIRMAPHATSLGSVLSVKSLVKSGNEIIGSEESHLLIFFKSLSRVQFK